MRRRHRWSATPRPSFTNRRLHPAAAVRRPRLRPAPRRATTVHRRPGDPLATGRLANRFTDPSEASPRRAVLPNLPEVRSAAVRALCPRHSRPNAYARPSYKEQGCATPGSPCRHAKIMGRTFFPTALYNCQMNAAVRAIMTGVTRIIGALSLCCGSWGGIIGLGPGGAVNCDERLFALCILLYGILCLLPKAVFKSRIVLVIFIVLTIVPVIFLFHTLTLLRPAQTEFTVVCWSILGCLCPPLWAILISWMPAAEQHRRR